MQVALEVDEHLLPQERPVAPQHRVRILLLVVGEHVMTPVEDLPGREAGHDPHAEDLAQEAVDRLREVAVGRVVDERVAHHLQVRRDDGEGYQVEAPGELETAPAEGPEQARRPEKEGHPGQVVLDVEPGVAEEVRRRLAKPPRFRGLADRLGLPRSGRELVRCSGLSHRVPPTWRRTLASGIY